MNDIGPQGWPVTVEEVDLRTALARAIRSGIFGRGSVDTGLPDAFLAEIQAGRWAGGAGGRQATASGLVSVTVMMVTPVVFGIGRTMAHDCKL